LAEKRVEIERKFRVRGEPWRRALEGVALRQGYLSRDASAVVRVRVAAASAWLTVKGPTRDVAREEFEFAIPRTDGEALLALCGDRVVEKTRYSVWEAGSHFEVDVFGGRNAGLVVAEIELEHPDQVFARPSWLAEEVSHDIRYRNSELCVHPYSEWPPEPSGRSAEESESSA
jgi:adenylate cyclase